MNGQRRLLCWKGAHRPSGRSPIRSDGAGAPGKVGAENRAGSDRSHSTPPFLSLAGVDRTVLHRDGPCRRLSRCQRSRTPGATSTPSPKAAAPRATSNATNEPRSSRAPRATTATLVVEDAAHRGGRPSAALEVGDQAVAGLDELVGFDAEHVMPRAGRHRPHLAPPQEVGLDEEPQPRRVTERWDAAVGM